MHQKFQSPKHRVSRSGTPSFRSRYAPFQVLETFMLGYYILFRGREPPPLIHPRKTLDDFDFPLPRIIPTEFLLRRFSGAVQKFGCIEKQNDL